MFGGILESWNQYGPNKDMKIQIKWYLTECRSFLAVPNVYCIKLIVPCDSISCMYK